MTAEPDEPTWGESWEGGRQIRRHHRSAVAPRTRVARSALLLAAVVALVTLTGLMVGTSGAERPAQFNAGTAPLQSPDAPLWSSPEVSESPEVLMSRSTPTPIPVPAPRPAPPQAPNPPPAPPVVSPPSKTTTPTVPPFVPISVEAEAPDSQLYGGAARIACAPCFGGWRVGYVGGPSYLAMTASMPSSGSRTIRVTYTTNGDRQLKIKLNGIDVDVRWLNGIGWEVPYFFEFTATIPAGQVQLVFYNDVSPAPDIDRVVIS